MKTAKKNKIIERYIEQHLPGYIVNPAPSRNLELIVVIPVYREKEYIFRTLKSLSECDNPKQDIEIILLFNAPENSPAEIINEQKEVADIIRTGFRPEFPSWIKIIVEEQYNIPKKHFGAGLARKAGMDIALARLFSIDKSDGLIVTLDADSLVTPDYFIEILKWFDSTNGNGACIYFEHPLSGNEFADEVYSGIIKYELHLRYYMQAWRQTGFPYAFHTMGSAMAMKALAYARIGGMPKKQAGEDFYFLQKLIPLGNFGEINTTTVIPSPRPSNRVIFGTGAAITKYLSGSDDVYFTYNYQAFRDLKTFFSLRSELFDLNISKFEQWSAALPVPLRNFLLNFGFIDDLIILKNDCSNCDIFSKRFFELFNAFKVVKYLNYTRDNFLHKTPLLDAALEYLKSEGIETDNFSSEKDLLLFFRGLERV